MVSPARSFDAAKRSASSTTRSSSARPTISARSPSSSISLRVTTSPESSLLRARTTLSDSLRTTSWPRRRSLVVELGVEGDAHLAAAREDVDGAVVVAAEEGAVGRRGLGELLDLLAQLGDVLARLTEGVGELLVLGDGLGELALGLEQALLEGAHPLGRVLQLAPELDDLLLERLDLLLELGHLLLVGVEAAFVLGAGRGTHSHLLDSPERPTYTGPLRINGHVFCCCPPSRAVG